MRRDGQGIIPCFFVFSAILAALMPDTAVRAEGVWTEVPPPVSAGMNAVNYSDRANAWAVGNQGNILRNINGAWTIFPSSTDKDLYAVCAQGGNDAWAVGAEGTLIHWNGDRWAVHADSGVATAQNLYAVAFLNESNGWAAGSGVVLHYDGSSWVSMLIPVWSGTWTGMWSGTWTGIAPVSSDYVWFCGNDRRLGFFDGTNFFDIEHTALPLPPDGKAWRAISFPYQRLGWIVGDDGKIARFNTTNKWALAGSPTGQNLYGLCVLPDPEWGYAVGAGGIRLRLWEDGQFRQEGTGGEDLRSVDLPNHDEGSAVGGIAGPRILSMHVRTTANSFIDMRAFPNPFEPKKGGSITFDHLPGNVTAIEIFTIEGDKVADLKSGISYRGEVGVAGWDGRINGRVAASGAYMARFSAPGTKPRMVTFLLVKR